MVYFESSKIFLQPSISYLFDLKKRIDAALSHQHSEELCKILDLIFIYRKGMTCIAWSDLNTLLSPFYSIQAVLCRFFGQRKSDLKGLYTFIRTDTDFQICVESENRLYCWGFYCCLFVWFFNREVTFTKAITMWVWQIEILWTCKSTTMLTSN